jgi:hypothetical protein
MCPNSKVCRLSWRKTPWCVLARKAGNYYEATSVRVAICPLARNSRKGEHQQLVLPFKTNDSRERLVVVVVLLNPNVAFMAVLSNTTYTLLLPLRPSLQLVVLPSPLSIVASCEMTFYCLCLFRRVKR